MQRAYPFGESNGSTSTPMFYVIVILALLSAPALGQTESAVLELRLHDPQGADLGGCMELFNASKDFHLSKCARAGEELVAKALPAGNYSVVATGRGFASQAATVALRSGERKSMVMALAVAPVTTEIHVQSGATLLDPTGASGQRLSASTISRLPAASPARTLIDAVQTQPGWVLEANGVLHPRGSEYDALYVIDGLPITTNLSPGFAPETALNQIDAIETTTGGYPAEYGRHLGGIVEVATATPRIDGVHGQVEFEQGSFATTSGSGVLSYAGKRTGLSGAFNGFTTDRYLDPPTETNFTNNAVGHSLSARVDHEFGGTQTLRLWFTNSGTRLDVPNETVQELAGQRQNRNLGQSAGYASYDRSLSNNVLLSARFMARNVTATLGSNQQSTPIGPQQDRGLHEEYLSLSVSAQHGGHEFKSGVQLSRNHIRERFSFDITDPAAFDPDVPANFDFAGRHNGQTEAVFVQDLYRHGPWTLSAGLRWDRYTLLARDAAWSPRISLAYYAAPLNLVLHASYDRAFEEPPVENLLFASSTSVLRLGREVAQIPVPLSRGDFAEAGISKLFSLHIRVDASAFLRNTRNVVDDDLLLNTGVSVPTTFARASIYGAELKLEMPDWGPLGGFVSYSYLLGRAITPVTGGLFLEAEAEELLQPGLVFPISQDQRNTAHGFLRYNISKSLWLATSFSYGSGLPTEIDPGLSREELIAQSSERIVDQLDLSRGRLKPNYSLDFSAGWNVWQHEHRAARVQLDVTNVTNKLNVINFAGLFSGTALATPRAAALRVAYSF